MTSARGGVGGRLSEFAGEETLKTDRVMRTLGMRHAAEREEADLGPELRALLERYCAGINAGAAAAKARPLEFRLLGLEWEPWTPVDVLALGKLLAFGLSTNWERELLRADMVRDLGPELTARLAPASPRGPPRPCHWSSRSTRSAARSASPPRRRAPTTGPCRASAR